MRGEALSSQLAREPGSPRSTHLSPIVLAMHQRRSNSRARTSGALPTALRGATLTLLGCALAQGTLAQDLIVSSGSTVIYDTDVLGRARYGRVEIQPGATLRVVGSAPFNVVATEVVIDGLLDASGAHALDVATLNTTNQPEAGAAGALGAGDGGTGSFLIDASTPRGGAGLGSNNLFEGPVVGGGAGGEASFSTLGRDARRGAGGGGGALARSQPVAANPLDPANRGLVATAGFDGGGAGTGAIGQSGPASGGAAGLPVFIDGNGDNDFWGRRLAPAGIVVGEARRPVAGRGGGAGGDGVTSDVFPPVSFSPFGDEKGAGGGAGGGLVAILARRIVIGPSGALRADGGEGAGGENSLFFDRVGGGSGGGSGGWLVLDALQIDLRLASHDAITALGGRGGEGRNNLHDVVGAGGNGGPGVIQLHVPSGTSGEILLRPGVSLGELTAPRSHVLLPILRP